MEFPTHKRSSPTQSRCSAVICASVAELVQISVVRAIKLASVSGLSCNYSFAALCFLRITLVTNFLPPLTLRIGFRLIAIMLTILSVIALALDSISKDICFDGQGSLLVFSLFLLFLGAYKTMLCLQVKSEVSYYSIHCTHMHACYNVCMDFIYR